ncbi:cytochrome c biogenesis protein CcdA [Actinobacteria bacterium YIM 96077]|uniref:Cytochrome c biogenesis protein CcdA n=1 Tax=Phytoactinopolyspora halophila TaxID=1981511 RepID=A0A329QQU2_9ACTN|nr:cytochrome c biogenesis protein CcdA [Phytoactinopolyspora halophila]AYY14804.1 cytochrome c biogenesis protein CcdA [Actinobacteria bacterium YIM 96077]RAW13078.1 cytochrome c biogenesis protein CcdA [Phytoactinopolyspora halophila]
MGSTFGEAVLSGSLVVAIPVAVIAGLVSFLSPCVLPLVPAYLGYVTGLSGPELDQAGRARLALGVSLFVLGFGAVFVSYGVFFGGIGIVLREHADIIVRVMGVFTILLGMAFAGWLPGVSRQWKPQATPAVGLAGAPALGVVFGLGWTPCMGPTLAAVQFLAFDEAHAGRGALLSFMYTVGLGLPLLLAALAYQRSMRMFSWLRRHQLAITRFGGVMLIVLGVLLASGLWDELMRQMQGWITGFEVIV